MPELSIIIPVLDEAESLPRLFAGLAAQRDIDYETIVADGGSGDDSVAVAERHGARVIVSAAGRGRQMNAGAAVAAGEWLLFLHADSRPRTPFQLRRAIGRLKATGDRRVAGHFSLRFDRERDDHRLLYRYMEEKSASNRPYTINGDQGLLIRRDWFEELGGFDESSALLEDQRIAERIRIAGLWVPLPDALSTSARRFEAEGARERYILMAIIMAMYAIDLQLFFDRAPGVYHRQGQTKRLLLTPYFRLLRALMRQMGWRASLRNWRRVGRFVLGESWQLFFALDVALRGLLGPGRYPATAFHDRLFAPLTHHRFGAWLTTALVFVYSMGVLQPWYRWRERRLLAEHGTDEPG